MNSSEHLLFYEFKYKTVPRYETDPPSSVDTSGGSNQRRKLAAPPMDVSLDHSEGSLLSENALDTEDEALDTGDDLDVNIDDMDTPDEGDSLEFSVNGIHLQLQCKHISF